MKNKQPRYLSLFIRNKGLSTGRFSPTVILNSFIYLGRGKSRRLVRREDAGSISKETKQYPHINHNYVERYHKLMPAI